MHSRLPLRLALGMAVLLLPASVLAYVTPEDALEGVTRVSPRVLHQRIAEQEQESENRRIGAQESIFQQQYEEEGSWYDEEELPAEDEEDMGAEENLEETLGAFQELLQTLSLQQQETEAKRFDQEQQKNIETARVLRRIEDRQFALRQLDQAQEESLHSGAPLIADTGPGMMLLGGSLAAAFLWTLRKVGRGTDAGI